MSAQAFAFKTSCVLSFAIFVHQSRLMHMAAQKLHVKFDPIGEYAQYRRKRMLLTQVVALSFAISVLKRRLGSCAYTSGGSEKLPSINVKHRSAHPAPVKPAISMFTLKINTISIPKRFGKKHHHQSFHQKLTRFLYQAGQKKRRRTTSRLN